MIERCFDYRRIQKFPDWRMCVSQELFYLMEVKDGKDLGVWTLHPWHDGLLIHASLSKECSGKCAKHSAIQAFNWVFQNTQYKDIYASISNSKRHAQFMAVSAGMNFIYSDNDKRYYKIDMNDFK